MGTGLLRNAAAVRALVCLGLAGLFVWEAFRAADKVARIEFVVMALLMPMSALMWYARSRKDPRPQWPTTTPWPRAAISLSLFPLGLGGVGIWAFFRWGDIFNLICAAGILTMGLWGVVLGVNSLRHRT